MSTNIECNEETTPCTSLNETKEIKVLATANEIIETIENDEDIECPSDDKTEVDPYSYTKRPGFTSEIFKIEVGNLPNHFGYTQLKKLFNSKMKLNTHKIKAVNQKPFFVFVTFRCEEDREIALKAINDYEFKGKKLTAKKANPMADPLVQKRQQGMSEDAPLSKKPKTDQTEDEISHIPVALRVKNAVAPYWEENYQKQLEMKQKDLRKLMVKWGREFERNVPAMFKWLTKQRALYNFMCCPLSEIIPSPETMGYRNKCEFNIGRHLETQEKTVGFRISSYKEGSKSVAEGEGCPNISQGMLEAAKEIQKYICISEKDVFNPETHEGYWRQLTARSSRNNDLMLTVVLHPQSLTEKELVEEQTKMKEFLITENSKTTSLFFQSFTKRSNVEPKYEHVWGKKYIEETLLDMRFRISPEAFFQVNTPAAEVLYTTVKELAEITSNTTILDLCCGTGTIGLTLAKHARKLVGVELCEPAVIDAKHNAKINEITNAQFICAKVEDVIFEVLNSLDGDDVVAIVDPPRAGLNNKVIKAIRNAKKIKKLIYLSCSPQSAMTNFVDLGRSISNNYQGEPFLPVKAVPVDMFPHTPHCELVVLFHRLEK